MNAGTSNMSSLNYYEKFLPSICSRNIIRKSKLRYSPRRITKTNLNNFFRSIKKDLVTEILEYHLNQKSIVKDGDFLSMFQFKIDNLNHKKLILFMTKIICFLRDLKLLTHTR